MTTFKRSFKGRNFGGMLLHVLLPMTTALIFRVVVMVVGLCAGVWVGETRFVTRAKKPISFFNWGHGRPPFLPMPREGVAARMSVRLCGFDIVDALVVGFVVACCVLCNGEDWLGCSSDIAKICKDRRTSKDGRGIGDADGHALKDSW